MRRTPFRSWATLLLCLLIVGAANVNAAVTITSVLFAGLGGHNNGDSTNDGSLATVNQTTGAVTIVGHPAGVSRISGLAFDPFGVLLAVTQPMGGFPPPPGPMGGSLLLQLNPTNGNIILSVPVTDGSNNHLSIADLAVQPGTGLLYGVESAQDGLNGQGKIWLINESTGVSTLVGNTGHFFGALAFAPNGTFYMTSADLDQTGNIVNTQLLTLNPRTAAILTAIPLAQQIEALAVRPEDGVIFGGNGDQAQLFTINPTTANLTLIGGTGTTFIGDLAFQSPFILGPGQCGALPFSLPAPAGPNGAIVNFSSSDTTKVIVDLGPSGDLFVPSSATTDRRTASVCGVNFGTANITVSGGGQTVIEPVLVTANMSFYPASMSVTVGTQARPVLYLSAPAPSALTITLVSSNTSAATVPSTVTIPAGSSSVLVPVAAVGAGTANIQATSSVLGSATFSITVH